MIGVAVKRKVTGPGIFAMSVGTATCDKCDRARIVGGIRLGARPSCASLALPLGSFCKWIKSSFNPALKPVYTKDLLAGYVGGIPITQAFVLVGAVLMETATAMVLLSRVLPYRAGRWANIIVGIIQTASVAWSMSGETNAFMMFFATIEIACTLFIVWYAWTWRNPEREPEGVTLDQGERVGRA